VQKPFSFPQAFRFALGVRVIYFRFSLGKRKKALLFQVRLLYIIRTFPRHFLILSSTYGNKSYFNESIEKRFRAWQQAQTEKEYKTVNGNLFTGNALFLFTAHYARKLFSSTAFRFALGVRVIYFRFQKVKELS